MRFLLSIFIACLAIADASPFARLEARGTPANRLSLGITPEGINKNGTIEAMRFDPAATRALTGTTIKTAAGKCLSVNPFSGDFRLNLLTIDIADCDGSKNQTWDVKTKGAHLDSGKNANGALLVNSLTNGCINFDPRKACGQQALVFSCGGRANGVSNATDSQTFTFTDGAGIQQLHSVDASPGSTLIDGCTGQDKVFHPTGVCLTVQGAILGVAECDSADKNQQFTYGGSAPGAFASDGLLDAGFYTQQDINALIADGFMTTTIGEEPKIEGFGIPPTGPAQPAQPAASKPNTGKQVASNSTTTTSQAATNGAADESCEA